jgi:hypothetical protein
MVDTFIHAVGCVWGKQPTLQQNRLKFIDESGDAITIRSDSQLLIDSPRSGEVKGHKIRIFQGFLCGYSITQTSHKRFAEKCSRKAGINVTHFSIFVLRIYEVLVRRRASASAGP